MSTKTSKPLPASMLPVFGTMEDARASRDINPLDAVFVFPPTTQYPVRMAVNAPTRRQAVAYLDDSMHKAVRRNPSLIGKVPGSYDKTHDLFQSYLTEAALRQERNGMWYLLPGQCTISVSLPE